MPVLSLFLPAAFTFALTPDALSSPTNVSASCKARRRRPPSGLTGLVAWGGAHWAVLLLGLYGLVAATGLIRLAVGLVLMIGLYRRAETVPEAWARGRNIRVSVEIAGPLSFADRILIPADYREWPEAKRLAVLAHEEAHVRRGDFFIQLLASIHRAVFWFSPFAWWLPLKLRDLAEGASDRAATALLDDPAGYAEILIDMSRQIGRRRARDRPSPWLTGRAWCGGSNKFCGTSRRSRWERQGRITILAMVVVGSVAVAKVQAAVALVPAALPAAGAGGGPGRRARAACRLGEARSGRFRPPAIHPQGRGSRACRAAGRGGPRQSGRRLHLQSARPAGRSGPGGAAGADRRRRGGRPRRWWATVVAIGQNPARGAEN